MKHWPPELWNALRIWAVTYVIVSGFLFYHSVVPLEALLAAGVLTFLITFWRTWSQTRKSEK